MTEPYEVVKEKFKNYGKLFWPLSVIKHDPSNEEIVFLTRTQFKTAFKDVEYICEKTGKRMKFLKRFMEDEHGLSRYCSIDFEPRPRVYQPSGMFDAIPLNTFREFDILSVTEEPIESGVTLFKECMASMMGSKSEIITMWLANILQDPGAERMPTLILIGQGAERKLLAKLMQAIIGSMVSISKGSESIKSRRFDVLIEVLDSPTPLVVKRIDSEKYSHVCRCKVPGLSKPIEVKKCRRIMLLCDAVPKLHSHKKYILVKTGGFDKLAEMENLLTNPGQLRAIYEYLMEVDVKVGRLFNRYETDLDGKIY